MEKEKKEKGEFIYLFCPGTTCPFSVVMTLLPLQSSLRGLSSFCPGGAFPSGEFLHSSAAKTGAATDETSIATDSATAIAAIAANVTLFVFISAPYNV